MTIFTNARLIDPEVQTDTLGWLRVEGDEVVGRWLTREVGRLAGGGSQTNYAIYHDRYVRTAEGWRFKERRYEFLLVSDEQVRGSFHRPDGRWRPSACSPCAAATGSLTRLDR